ncbi:hypothetical protein RBB50_006625 [Rhinocladiella similis]
MHGKESLRRGVSEYFCGHYGGNPAPSPWDGSDDGSCIDPRLRGLQQEHPYPSLDCHAYSQIDTRRCFTAYDPVAHGFDQNPGNAYDSYVYHHSFPDLLPGLMDEHRLSRNLFPSGNTPLGTECSAGDFGFSPDALRFQREVSFTFESPVSAHSPPGMPTTPLNMWTPHHPNIISPMAAFGGNLALSMRDLQVTPDPEGDESFMDDRDQIHTKIKLPQELELAEQLASPPASTVSTDEDGEIVHGYSGALESDSDSEFIPASHRSRRGPAALRHLLGSPRQQKRKAIIDPHARIRKASNDQPPTIGKSRPKAKKMYSKRHIRDSKSFPCPFHHFGCPATFANKNEWKRHVSSQHLQLGFYRCDMDSCSPESTQDHHRGYNDFNRKDLFTQHCRRMHAPWARTDRDMKNVSKKDREKFEKKLEQIRARCWIDARKPPERTKCGFCEKSFIEGQSDDDAVTISAWDQRMDHLGRHYEKDGFDAKDEQLDEGLQKWALDQGVIREGRIKNRYWLVGLELAEKGSGPARRRRSGRVTRGRGWRYEEEQEKQDGENSSEKSEEDMHAELDDPEIDDDDVDDDDEHDGEDKSSLSPSSETDEGDEEEDEDEKASVVKVPVPDADDESEEE